VAMPSGGSCHVSWLVSSDRGSLIERIDLCFAVAVSCECCISSQSTNIAGRYWYPIAWDCRSWRAARAPTGAPRYLHNERRCWIILRLRMKASNISSRAIRMVLSTSLKRVGSTNWPPRCPRLGPAFLREDSERPRSSASTPRKTPFVSRTTRSTALRQASGLAILHAVSVSRRNRVGEHLASDRLYDAVWA